MRLRIEKAVYGGNALARIPTEEGAAASGGVHRGKAVFVPDALPGELVEVRIQDSQRNRHEGRGYAKASLERVVESSPGRIPPLCEYVPLCGGCQYQHAGTAFQVEMKLGILRETLDRAHLSASARPEAIEAVTAQPWGYRNRIRLGIRGTGAGKEIQLCYRERASHRDVHVRRCPIAAPILERAITAVLDSGKYAEPAKHAEEIEFFTNGKEVLLSLFTAEGHPQKLGWADEFAKRVETSLPELAGVKVFGRESKKTLDAWGSSSLVYPVAGHEYRISAGAFFQVNRFLLEDMLRLAAGGHSGKLAWDLYAGVGFFSQALDFDEIVAVEADPFSAGDLAQNLGPHQRAMHSTTLDFLKAAVRRKTPAPDLVLTDPPRAGLGREICEMLAHIGARRIVYVSCDPATLARDLQALLQSGYRVQTMTLVDLFPQTFHIETVTLLERL